MAGAAACTAPGPDRRPPEAVVASEPDPVRVASGMASATRELQPWLLWAASRSSKRGLQTDSGALL